MKPHYTPRILSGSNRPPLSITPNPVPCDQDIQVTIALEDIQSQARGAIQKFALDHDLRSYSLSGRRTLQLFGAVDDFQKAFNVELHHHTEETGQTVRVRAGGISVPDNLECHITAVLGLDTRPVAKPYLKRPRDINPDARAKALEVLQVASAYGAPMGVTGKGQTIAIIELGGGYDMRNIEAYFQRIHVPVPAINALTVDDAVNLPGQSDADGEVELDIEVAGAVAPGATINVYFAPNTDAGFLNALTAAIHSTADIISVSWGGPEDGWTIQSMRAMNQALEDARHLGKNVFIAAGDAGAGDGERGLHADFPSSNPNGIACGGTRLVLAGGVIREETVWDDSSDSSGGGGVSGFFARPSYQAQSNVPKLRSFIGRGVPDLSGNADPVSGYRITSMGQDTVVGGTSAVAPLFAGIAALLAETLGSPIPYLNPILYAHPEAFRDVTSGSNNGYKASKGWDACSGLGSPDFGKLLAILKKVVA